MLVMGPRFAAAIRLLLAPAVHAAPTASQWRSRRVLSNNSANWAADLGRQPKSNPQPPLEVKLHPCSFTLARSSATTSARPDSLDRPRRSFARMCRGRHAGHSDDRGPAPCSARATFARAAGRSSPSRAPLARCAVARCARTGSTKPTPSAGARPTRSRWPATPHDEARSPNSDESMDTRLALPVLHGRVRRCLSVAK